MLQRTVRQIKITPKFILHQNAKFSTRQYFHLYSMWVFAERVTFIRYATALMPSTFGPLATH